MTPAKCPCCLQACVEQGCKATPKLSRKTTWINLKHLCQERQTYREGDGPAWTIHSTGRRPQHTVAGSTYSIWCTTQTSLGTSASDWETHRFLSTKPESDIEEYLSEFGTVKFLILGRWSHGVNLVLFNKWVSSTCVKHMKRQISQHWNWKAAKRWIMIF